MNTFALFAHFLLRHIITSIRSKTIQHCERPSNKTFSIGFCN